MHVFAVNLTVTIPCCFVPLSYKPPAKTGTLASPLKRTQDIITDLGSKNDILFAKWSALYCQFLAFQTPCNDSIPSSLTVIWQDSIQHHIECLLSTISNKKWGLHAQSVPGLQHGVMCGIPFFVLPIGRWQKSSKHLPRTWGWKLNKEVLLLLCSLIKSLG